MMKISLIICLLSLMVPSVLPVNESYKTEIPIISSSNDFNLLITEFGANDSFSRVIEVDINGIIVWEKTGLVAPMDAERLPNGNTLITEFGSNAVKEFDPLGNVVWQKKKLQLPMDAERLDNGNTLITEYNRGTVTEFDAEGNKTWEKTGLSRPFDAERLPNGHTLIVETDLYPDGYIREVDEAGNEIWNMTDLDAPMDIEKLINKSTGKVTYLIDEHVGKRIFEIDEEDTIIWQKTGLLVPKDAERFDDGRTVIAECGADRVIIVNEAGNIVWVLSGLNYPCDVEILPVRQPPKVEIVTPKQGYFHLRGRPLFSILNRTIIYGPVNIEVDVNSTSGVNRVEFYINDKLKENDTIAPYGFRWAPIISGPYTIKAVAYDYLGKNASVDMKVLKWRFHPLLILVPSALLLGIISQG
ncbi:MAG: hypothetical protein AYK22_03695 [Thermoplasmatales archaeon SG8-52-3]|nr:MAG: hypothetical protein AYK22_03695 [Thermoplasmatales archaeon SG8-52-3]